VCSGYFETKAGTMTDRSSPVTNDASALPPDRLWQPTTARWFGVVFGGSLLYGALRFVVTKFCGLMGFFLAAGHAFFSLGLLTPAYFGKYFAADGQLNLQGELGLAAGVVALFFLLSPAITTLPMMAKAVGGWRWKRAQRLGYAALTLVVVHLVALGLKGWLEPATWPAALPPISLIAALIAVLPLLAKRIRLRGK
jgi:DMSO/TMAO reductase YedYZ heme-binding membrane subunit